MSIVVGRLAHERDEGPPVTVSDKLRPLLDDMTNPRALPVPVRKFGWGYKDGVLFEYYTTGQTKITWYNGLGPVVERWE